MADLTSRLASLAGLPRGPPAEKVEGDQGALPGRLDPARPACHRARRLLVALGEPLEEEQRRGTKRRVDPPHDAWALIWAIRRVGVKVWVDPRDPDCIRLHPAVFVSEAQRQALERLSYDVWWLSGEAPCHRDEDLSQTPPEPEISPDGLRRLRRYDDKGRRLEPDWWVTSRTVCEPGEACVWADPPLHRACQHTCPTRRAQAPEDGDSTHEDRDLEREGSV